MRKFLCIITIFILMLIITIFITFNNTKINASTINDTANSTILMDIDNNRVLYENNINNKHLTASIAKILTCIVAIENGDLNKICIVNNETINQIGSSIYLKINDKVYLKDLLYGLMLRSGNDAAYLISINVCNSVQDFVCLMNKTANKIKMFNSYFENPSGLDNENKNISTAYDMALLMSYCMKNKIFKDITSTEFYSFTSLNDNKYYFNNKHKLIKNNKYCVSGKTGYTELAKRTLVSVFSKNNINVVVVTFNCGNDWELHEKLFEYAINNFENKIIIEKGILNYQYINYSATPIIYEDVSYIINKNETLLCEVNLLNDVNKENIIGIIKLYIDNKIVKEVLIYRYY